MRAWAYWQVEWGATLCDVDGCTNEAGLLSDDQPLCIPHADRQLEWLGAVSIAPAMAYQLPPWTEQPVAAERQPLRSAA